MKETLSGDDWTLVVAAFHSPIDLEFKRFGPWRDPSRPLRWFCGDLKAHRSSHTGHPLL